MNINNSHGILYIYIIIAVSTIGIDILWLIPMYNYVYTPIIPNQ